MRIYRTLLVDAVNECQVHCTVSTPSEYEDIVLEIRLGVRNEWLPNDDSGGAATTNIKLYLFICVA